MTQQHANSEEQFYDIIGDIHGHADELAELLELLGYELVAGRSLFDNPPCVTIRHARPSNESG